VHRGRACHPISKPRYEYDSGFAPGVAFAQKPVLVGMGGAAGKSDSTRLLKTIGRLHHRPRLCGVLGGVIGFVFGLFWAWRGTPPIRGAALSWLLYRLIVEWLYFALFESSSLQATPGKMALGIVVTNMDGERVGLESHGRYWGKDDIRLIIGSGFSWPDSPSETSLHDIMAAASS